MLSHIINLAVMVRSLKSLLKAMAVTIVLGATEASWGNQWVVGNVGTVSDYTGHANGGLLVVLTNQSWPYSSASCIDQRFSIKIGEQGVSEETKNRMWSALLTAAATGRSVGLFVDTASTPFCQVQIVSAGSILP